MITVLNSLMTLDNILSSLCYKCLLYYVDCVLLKSLPYFVVSSLGMMQGTLLKYWHITNTEWPFA